MSVLPRLKCLQLRPRDRRGLQDLVAGKVDSDQGDGRGGYCNIQLVEERQVRGKDQGGVRRLVLAGESAGLSGGRGQ